MNKTSLRQRLAQDNIDWRKARLFLGLCPKSIGLFFRTSKSPLPLRIVFGVIWHFNGRKPGSLTLTTTAIAAELIVPDRRVREWLPKIEEAGLIRTLKRYGDGGRLIEVFDPDRIAVDLRLKRPESPLLPGMEEIDGPTPSDGRAAETVRFPPTPSEAPPTNGGNPAESVNPNGGNPAETVRFPPRPSIPRAPSRARSVLSSIYQSSDQDGDKRTVSNIADWQAVREEMGRIARALWPHRNWSSYRLHRDQWDFLMRVACLALYRFPSDWIETGIAATVRRKNRDVDPDQYFKGVLRNRAAEQHGVDLEAELKHIIIPRQLIDAAKPKGDL